MANDVHPLTAGSGDFVFNDVKGDPTKSVRVFYNKPSNYNTQTPILIVLHGIQRNAQDYRDQWVEYATQYGALLIVPEFSAKNFPNSDYAQGNLFDANFSPRPASASGFVLIEHLFDEVISRTNNQSKNYFLYGHSAGAQFVHRMLLLKPEARINRAVAANAGFYTLPRFAEEYPYGLERTGLSRTAIPIAFAKNLTVLLGEQDILENQSSLDKSPGAMLQGRYRLARGMNFYQVAQEESAKSGATLAWKLKSVPGAGHSNSKMAAAAAQVLFSNPKN